MQADGDIFAHARAAAQPSPAVGSCVQVVRRTMLQFRIPHAGWPAHSESGVALKKRLKTYRKQIVAPALVDRFEDGRPVQPALPWGWIAKTSLPQRGFQRWWHLRCLQAWPSPIPDACPMCHCSVPPTWEPLLQCGRLQDVAAELDCTCAACFG